MAKEHRQPITALEKITEIEAELAILERTININIPKSAIVATLKRIRMGIHKWRIQQ